MKVALVHDWLNGMRGGEKCLEALCELFPEAPIYTLFHEKGKISPQIEKHPIRTSWMQRLPGIYKSYRNYLPFFPGAIESFDLQEFDLIISTSHCVAKGAKKRPEVLHICYCFTPVRYAWGLFEEYFGDKNLIFRLAVRHAIESLKKWDRRTSSRVDCFIAISKHIRDRIGAAYQRSAEVIYPPVETDFYTPDPKILREDFYLIVSALVPYKKIDLAIRAFNSMKRPLVIIGSGPEREKLQRMSGPGVSFLGWQPNSALLEYYRKAKALIFPGEEDFGIVPLEFQACGGAVIAYAKGGALETVLDQKTGLFFDKLSEEALIEAVARFEAKGWAPEFSVENAARFGRERFKNEISTMIFKKFNERQHAAAAT